MKVITVQPREIYVEIELALSEIDELSLALSASRIVFDGEKGKVATKTLMNFSKMLNDVLKNVKVG